MKKALYPLLFALVLFATACSGGSRTSNTAKNYKASIPAAERAEAASTKPTTRNASPGVKVGSKSPKTYAFSAEKNSTSKTIAPPAVAPPAEVPAAKAIVAFGSNGVASTVGPQGPTGPAGNNTSGYKAPIKSAVDLPKASQITAAEWNDLHNWQDWNTLITKPEFETAKSAWDIQLRERYSVFVTNKNDLPVVDADVKLYNENGQIIWEAKTDNSGKAELWNGIEKTSVGIGKEIRVSYKGEKERVKKAKQIQDGVNHIQLKSECHAPQVAELMFVVDATGSMGDEINFLKAELGDVLNRVQNINEDLELKVGSVFYRDQNDKFLTRVSNLSSDFSKTTQFISEQKAGGGGDYPEAVEEGLAQAINQDWSEEAVSRIIFLLLDAPPHDTPESKSKMREQIELAAQKGIKVVPVSASGINRQTEFLLKFASIITNGTYVFITDDSGIGGKHLTPVVSDFQVEFLNDAMVRIIENFTRQNSCDEIEEDVVESTDQDETQIEVSTEPIEEEIIEEQGFDHEINSWMDEIVIYPNPASNYVNIKSPRDLDKVEVLGSSGMVLLVEKNLSAGVTRLELEPLVDGFYFLQFYEADRIQTKQLVKKRRGLSLK